MKKCSNCGTEFEGNCCPKCGTWTEEERTCPKCGNKLKAGANFCAWCGYSFGASPEEPPKQKSTGEGKLAKIGRWIKKHLFIVIPAAVAVIVAIILACTIPACIAAKNNGTYYLLLGNGEIDKETYFIIDSGEWKDEDGESGTYKKDGDKITFYVEFFGSNEEMDRGTLKDGILKLGEGDDVVVYISSSHKHKYGSWGMTKAPCMEDGEEARSCACGANETREIKKRGHSVTDEWQINETNHYKICTVCSQKVEENKHSNSNFCGICYYGTVNANGLKLGLSNSGNEYSVIGIESKAGKNIKIPDSCNELPVTSIGGGVFRDCSSLTSITIPDSVTSIGYEAFYHCSSLTSLTIGNGVTSFDIKAFYGCSSLISITIPDSVTSIGGRAFGGCSSLISITIPDSVTSIGSGAFSGCDKIIQTGNGVRYVDKWVVGCDTSVTEAILRNDTKGIASCAFQYCSSLTSITIPDSVTSIGNDAFSDCSSLTSVTISNGVTSISYRTFEGCSSLISVTIGNSVTYIDYSVFKDCSSLTDITFKGTKAQWNAIKKESYWNENTGNYTIHCTDGDISK